MVLMHSRLVKRKDMTENWLKYFIISELQNKSSFGEGSDGMVQELTGRRELIAVQESAQGSSNAITLLRNVRAGNIQRTFEVLSVRNNLLEEVD